MEEMVGRARQERTINSLHCTTFTSYITTLGTHHFAWGKGVTFFYGLLISPKLVGGHTVIRASPRIARRLVSDISPISYILRDWRKRIGRIKGGKEEERGTLEGDHPRRRNWEKTKIPLGIFYTARLPDALALLHCK